MCISYYYKRKQLDKTSNEKNNIGLVPKYWIEYSTTNLENEYHQNMTKREQSIYAISSDGCLKFNIESIIIINLRCKSNKWNKTANHDASTRLKLDQRFSNLKIRCKYINKLYALCQQIIIMM